MATVDKAFADKLIKHNGWIDEHDHDAPDNPQAVRITKFIGLGGEAYGVVFAHERDIDSDSVAKQIEQLVAGIKAACDAPPPPVAEPSVNDTQALADVSAERLRQISAEGWVAEHDDKINWDGQLLRAAVCYAWPIFPYGSANSGKGPHDPRAWAPSLWPWDQKWWKPKDKRRNLIRAAALILAEIERLDRVVNPAEVLQKHMDAIEGAEAAKKGQS